MKAIIEIPKGSTYKYEVDKLTGVLTVDRIVHMKYPQNYGFIPNTLGEDGDPLDIFVFSSDPIYPLSRVNVEVIGIIKMTDNGVRDDKIIAKLKDDNLLPISAISDLIHFLRAYKSNTEVLAYENAGEALRVIEQCVNKGSFPNG